MKELRIPLQPKQQLFLQSIEKTPNTLFGGAKGGGKSHGLRNIMLLRRFQYRGTNGAIFRKTYPELEGNHIRPLFQAFPELRPYYNESKKLLTIPNGSTLEFCYARNEKDLDNYQGREFHDLFIDEAGQWTEQMFTKLQGSNRSSIPGIKPRCALTGNPGGIGHQWLKRLFIKRQFTPRERPSDYAFIQALVDDNAALMENDPDYVFKLEAEKNEALRRAFRFGDWDIFAGQFFSEIRADIHLIKPFPIPKHWVKSGSYDYGFNHPAVFGWFAVDDDGNVYLYREFAKAKLRVDQFAAELNKFPDTKDLYPVIGGLDCWTNKGTLRNDARPPTIAEEFATHGIHLKPAVTDRIQGANQVRKYLAWEGRPNNKPRLFIFDTCPITFDCLTRMIHDPDRIEDVLKVDAVDGDTSTGDDPFDMVRYFLMSRPMLADTLPPKHEEGSRAWAEEEAKRLEQEQQEEFEREKQRAWWENT